MTKRDDEQDTEAQICGWTRASASSSEDFDPQEWGGAASAGEALSFSPARAPEIRDLASARTLLAARFRVQRVFQAGLFDQVERVRVFMSRAARAAGGEAADLSTLMTDAGFLGWCPAEGAPTWSWLWRAFEAFEAVFGVVPPVAELGFYRLHYRMSVETGSLRLVPSEETLAMFGGGSMAVFRNAEVYAGGKPMPAGRSTREREAPLLPLAPADGFAFCIAHELAHGLVERTPGGLDRLEEFKLFAGWAPDGLLYDAGSDKVEVIGSRLRLDPGQRIAAKSWNRGWEEQPISQYSTTHAVEDFAESAAAYVLCPKLLATRAPRRSAFFEGSWPRS